MMKKSVIGVSIALGVISIFAFSSVFFASLKTVNINGVDFTINKDFEKNLLESGVVSVFSDEILNNAVVYNLELQEIYDRTDIEKLKDNVMGNSYELSYTYDYDFEKLKSLIGGGNITSQDAYIAIEDGRYVVVNEVYGNVLDEDLLKTALTNQEYNLNIEDFYVKPNILKADLQDIVTQMNRYIDWSCKYKDDLAITVTTDNVFYKDDEIVFDTESFKKQIKEIAKKYNTVGIEREFITHTGETKYVSGGTWGSSVDTEKEYEFVVNAFKNLEVIENRTPVYSYNREDIGNTYIEVSISDQHLWVFQDGKITMDTDIVTGTKNKHDTPFGFYYISECIGGKYLTGDDYKTWVNQWMRITDRGHGLHDAYWRGSFGGSIYKSNGSHGCVNLPPKFAKNLFEIAYRGMPVIIY